MLAVFPENPSNEAGQRDPGLANLAFHGGPSGNENYDEAMRVDVLFLRACAIPEPAPR